MNADIERTRVPEDVESAHPELFPLEDISRPARSARSVCKSIGLNWLAARRLYEAEWLSFDPKTVARLRPDQEAELSFLGVLVVAGCDEALLAQMLADLRKPYAYRIDRMYYDWQSQAWRLLPRGEQLERTFQTWFDELADNGELEALEDLRQAVERAIHLVRHGVPW